MASSERNYTDIVLCFTQLFLILAYGKSDVIFRYLILDFDLASTWLRYGFDIALPTPLLPSRSARKNSGLFHDLSARFPRTPFSVNTVFNNFKIF